MQKKNRSLPTHHPSITHPSPITHHPSVNTSWRGRLEPRRTYGKSNNISRIILPNQNVQNIFFFSLMSSLLSLFFSFFFFLFFFSYFFFLSNIFSPILYCLLFFLLFLFFFQLLFSLLPLSFFSLGLFFFLFTPQQLPI